MNAARWTMSLALVAGGSCTSAALPVSDPTAAPGNVPSAHEPCTAAPPPKPPEPTEARATLDDLTRERVLLDESKAALDVSDVTTARSKLAECVKLLLDRSAERMSEESLAMLYSAGRAAYEAADLRTAQSAFQRLFDVRSRTLTNDDRGLQLASQALAMTLRELGDVPRARQLEEEVLAAQLRTLPADHRDVQVSRLNLAVTMALLGDYSSAEELDLQVVDAFSRTLPDDHLDLQTARHNLAANMYRQGHFAGARALQEKILDIESRVLPAEDPSILDGQLNLALTLHALGDLDGARRLQEHILAIRERTLPEDHPALLTIRTHLASTRLALGDLAGARELSEKALDVATRTLPDDDPDLQVARINLALVLRALGEPRDARVLVEQALDARSRVLADDHPDVQSARGNLASILFDLGYVAEARTLFESVLEVQSRTHSDDDPTIQSARANIGMTMLASGDRRGAQELLESVLEIQLRTLSDDHPDVQTTRLHLAEAFAGLGDLPRARELEEKVLEICVRTLHDDHPILQRARAELARTLTELGDLARARALQEKVLDVRLRTLPPDHLSVQTARQALANTIRELGDAAGARALFEQVLEVRSRALPDEHPDLQAARSNLAEMLTELGDPEAARALLEKVFDVASRTLPDDHPDLQAARQNLAATLCLLGDVESARALQEKALDVASTALPKDHPSLQLARQNLALTLRLLGRFESARTLEEQVLDVRSRTLLEDHPDLHAARRDLAITLAHQAARSRQMRDGSGGLDERAQCSALVAALCDAVTRTARGTILESTSREAEERCASLAANVDVALSFASGYGVFERMRELEEPAFVLSETTRGAELAWASSTRRAQREPKYLSLRDELRASSRELAAIARQGTTSDAFDRARTKKESIERELGSMARALSGDEEIEFGVDSLAAALGDDTVAVAFRRFDRRQVMIGDELDSTGRRAVHDRAVAHLCAFAVSGSRGDGSSALTFADLGPSDDIATAVTAWREALNTAGPGRGVSAGAQEGPSLDSRALGLALRSKIFGPLMPVITGARRIVVVLDDVLHVVPLDALPFDQTTAIGEHWRIETRATLTELLHAPDVPMGPGSLVAIGDIEYELEAPRSASPSIVAAAMTPPAASGLANLRGTIWSDGFAALPATAAEVHGIADWYRRARPDDRAPEILEGRDATSERLLEFAPSARYLHVATHGWFAPDSIPTWNDAEPLDEQTGLGRRQSGDAQVRGMNPMLLCGIALAGANSFDSGTGRMPGLLTAQELATLDLSNCELAVLSACDTNLGVSRAGQGVGSLQKALQMAGARSVITSLWKVPDEATKELMLDFYRGMWVEKKPKWQALWEAKSALRNAKDERGDAKYTTRDWAAWVLTGNPQ